MEPLFAALFLCADGIVCTFPVNAYPPSEEDIHRHPFEAMRAANPANLIAPLTQIEF